MAEKHTGSRAKAVLGGKGKSKSKSGKKPHSIHVKRGKSGGFIVTHHHVSDDAGVTPEPEDHVVPDLDSLHQHVDDSMGDQGPAPAPEPPAPVGASAAVAPSPAAGGGSSPVAPTGM